MKKYLRASLLPFLILGLGGLSLALLILMYAFGTDQQGLVHVGNPIPAVVVILTAAAIALTAAVVRPLEGFNRFADNFPPSIPGAAGAFLAAAGVFSTAMSLLPQAGDAITVLTMAAAFLSAAGLAVTGLCRIKGLRPFVGCHGVVCVFFALYLVCRYRSWSADPQLLDYAFCLCACVALMLYAYHRTAFDAGVGRRKMTLFTGLTAVYLCCAALAAGENRLLYLGCGAWALLNLCPFTLLRRRKPQEPEAAE